MSTVRIGTALVDFKAKDAGFAAVTRRARKEVGGFDKVATAARKTTARYTAALAGLKRSFGGVAVTAAAVSAVFYGINRALTTTAKAGAELQNFADQVGISVTTLQALQRAGGDWNIEAGTISQAMTRFSRVIGEAGQGLATYTRIFDSLGVNIRDSGGNLRDTESVFADFAKALQGVGSSAERNALLMQAFGRQGARLGELFDSVGQKGLANFNQEMRNAGVLTQSQVDSLQNLNRQWNSLGDVMTYHRRVVVAGVSDEWADMLESFQKAAPLITDIIGPAFTGLVTVFANVVEGIANTVSWVDKLLERMGIVQRDIEKKLLERIESAAAVVRGNLLQGVDIQNAPKIVEQLTDAVKEATKAGIEVPMEIHLLLNRAGFSRTLYAALGQSAGDIQEQMAERTRESLSVLRAEQEKRRMAPIIAERNRQGALRAQFEANEAVIRAASERAAVAAEKVAEAQARIRHQQGLIPLRQADTAARARSERLAVNLADHQPTSLSDALANTERLQREAAQPSPRFRQIMEEAGKAQEKLRQGMERNQQVLSGMQSGFENFFTALLDGTASASDAFKSLAADIARAVTQALIIQPLASALTGGIQSFFNIPVPAGAAQGGVANAGRPYLVGELGPELFVPRESGRIVANKDMTRGVTVNQQITIRAFDDTGFDSKMAAWGEIISEQTRAAVHEDINRPGYLPND